MECVKGEDSMTVSLPDGLLLGCGGGLVRPAVVLHTKAVINSACHRVGHGSRDGSSRPSRCGTSA
jgi:fatty-acid desaturase